MMLTYIALGIFALTLFFIIFDLLDQALVALGGALLMIMFGVLTADQALAAVDFRTIFLLMAMMILVFIASKSNIFAWINVKIAVLTRGNPFAIFLFFSLLTGVCSAFLDNVTTVILVVPLVIELVTGMGKNPKPYIFSTMVFANLGGSLTLIGDGSNILIGGASGLSFTDFIANLWIPVALASLLTIAYFSIVYWKALKPASDNLVDTTIANIIIKRIKEKFLHTTFKKSFVIKVVFFLLATILGFFFQHQIGLPNYVIALIGAVFLALATHKEVSVHETLKAVEWSTIFFFAGLFVLVAGIENTGLLESLSNWVANSTTNLFYLSVIILWVSGIPSMLINNIPFVTLMIPVIIGIQAKMVGVEDLNVLWWALSMGACLGGSGTLVGASANVVTAGLAKKAGHPVSFIEHLKFNLPLTLGILLICTGYLYFRLA